LLAPGWWFSPGTPVSSTNDIKFILTLDLITYVRIRIKLNINMKLFTIESSKIDTNYFKTSFWGKLYFI
jgi:hypothetical protein